MTISGTENGYVTTTSASTSLTNLGISTIATSSYCVGSQGGNGITGGYTNDNIYRATTNGNGNFTGIAFANGTTFIGNTTASGSIAGVPTGTNITVTSGANTLSLQIVTAGTGTLGGYQLCTSAQAIAGVNTTSPVTPSTLTSALAAPPVIGSTTLAAATFSVLTLGTVGGVQFLSGSGSPNGVVTAPQGSWYLNTGTPVGLVDRAFINTDSGTTWTGITSVA